MSQQNWKIHLSNWRQKTGAFMRGAWFFPSILTFLLLLLTALQISGSSIGAFHSILYGDAPNSDTLAGSHKLIRSDEWEVNTPLVLSQDANGYPRVNPDIGNGQDMSVVLDVPYKEWSTLFKPQHWAFFALPVSFAFAFKWWLLAYILLLATYAFTLTLLPRKYLLASFVAIGLFCSPFVQWWYQSATILPIAYGLAIGSVVIQLTKTSLTKRIKIALSTALFYLLVCFAFVLYVPFIVPVGLVIAAFLVGHVLNQYFQAPDRRTFGKQLIYIGAPIIAALFIVGIFVATRPIPIEAISQSVYPGHRTEESGKYSFRQLTGGYFNYGLQQPERAVRAPLNQSEASSFIYLFPFIMPALALVWWRQRVKTALSLRTIDWRIVALLAILALFFVRLFVPFSDTLFSLLQLNRIPHNRLIIGLGVVNLCALLISMQYLSRTTLQLSSLARRLSAFGAFLAVFLIGLSYRATYPGYIDSRKEIVVVSLVTGLIVWLLVSKRFTWAMGIMTAFAMFSVGHINPLQQGLKPLHDSRLSHALTSVGDDKGKWVVSSHAESLENVTLANGLHSLSGVYAYPQLDVWKALGTDKEQKDVYNRYAHVFFTTKPVDESIFPADAYLEPPALDAFRVVADPCGPFLKEHNVRYILTTIDHTDSPCVKLIKEISYPALTLKIYEIKPTD